MNPTCHLYCIVEIVGCEARRWCEESYINLETLEICCWGCASNCRAKNNAHVILTRVNDIKRSFELYGYQKTIQTYDIHPTYIKCIGITENEIEMKGLIANHINNCGKSHEEWIFFERAA